MRPPQEGLAHEERILCPLLSKKLLKVSRAQALPQGPALGPRHGVWLLAKEFPFPRGDCLGEMAIWEQPSWCSFGYTFCWFPSVCFLMGFLFLFWLGLTLLHFCLFLIIWPNALVFFWFFFPLRPLAYMTCSSFCRMMCHPVCVCFFWRLWKPKLKHHENEMSQSFWLRQRPSC